MHAVTSHCTCLPILPADTRSPPAVLPYTHRPLAAVCCAEAVEARAFADPFTILKATKGEDDFVYIDSPESGVLPSFVETFVVRHINATYILRNFDRVYLLLQRVRPGGAAELAADLEASESAVAAVRLHPPEWLAEDAVRLGAPEYYLLGWVLLHRPSFDPRMIAIDLFEVPQPLRHLGLGNLLMECLTENWYDGYPDGPILPAQPVESSLAFWGRCAQDQLDAFIHDHGVGEARELCIDKLNWPIEMFEHMAAACSS